jgi:hypothetical protein
MSEFTENVPIPSDFNTLQEDRSTFELLNEGESELIERIKEDLGKENCC